MMLQGSLIQELRLRKGKMSEGEACRLVLIPLIRLLVHLQSKVGSSSRCLLDAGVTGFTCCSPSLSR